MNISSTRCRVVRAAAAITATASTALLGASDGWAQTRPSLSMPAGGAPGTSIGLKGLSPPQSLQDAAEDYTELNAARNYGIKKLVDLGGEGVRDASKEGLEKLDKYGDRLSTAVNLGLAADGWARGNYGQTANAVRDELLSLSTKALASVSPAAGRTAEIAFFAAQQSADHVTINGKTLGDHAGEGLHDLYQRARYAVRPELDPMSAAFERRMMERARQNMAQSRLLMEQARAGMAERPRSNAFEIKPLPKVTALQCPPVIRSPADCWPRTASRAGAAGPAASPSASPYRAPLPSGQAEPAAPAGAWGDRTRPGNAISERSGATPGASGAQFVPAGPGVPLHCDVQGGCR